MKRYAQNQDGWVKPVFTLFLLVVLSYVGFKFAVPYYHYHAFKADARDIARLNYRAPDKYQELLCESAEGIGVPLDCGSIRVSVSDKRVYVRTSWTETVDLMGYYQKTLRFKIDIEE